ncbi:putative inositol-1-monophosphatase [Papiliotrema laurentii]|uniref:Inositol-1-monophosphatase n=1 Tax=Papiliotrema laurentii TaxID=5418 RepID=A0AAD9FPS1_PAPLA|nr:putative inositol-1-monophosphatase [Papiliotrema laurentii]
MAANGHAEDYDELLDFAYSLAEQATALILKRSSERWVKTSVAEAKKNTIDLVTETDQEVEELIKREVSERYAEHKFIGEETYEKEGTCTLTEEYTWIVDPIDGTMNFVHGNPFVACSIGVLHRKRPIVGVIAQPFLGRIFSARLGGGAFMNRTTPLPLTGGIPQPLDKLSDCIFSAEWGSDRSAKVLKARSESFVKLAGDPTKGSEGGKMCHALRTTGSSACSIVMVAAGEIDIYWDAGCYAWDVAAGAVIVPEAGGFFSGGKDGFRGNISLGDAVMSRRYVFVRGVQPSQDEEPRQIQERLVEELYDTVTEWTTSDM